MKSNFLSSLWRMKILTFLLFAITVPVAPMLAQDSTASEIESTANSILADPRLQNMMRGAKEDSDKLADEAMRMFSENKDKIDSAAEKVDTSGIDTPENRAKAKSAATALIPSITKMLPAPKPSNATDVPATRSATTTPAIAIPDEPDPAGTTNLASATANRTVVQEASVQPIETASLTASTIPEKDIFGGVPVPDPIPLTPQYETTASGALKSKKSTDMEVTSKEWSMDNNTGVMTFLGNVKIDHPQFSLRCDKLRIEMGKGGEASSGIKKAIASGGTVEIRRVAEKGELQVALAKRAEYDGATRDFILSGGPPSITAGERLVKTNSSDATIIMRGTGEYEINGSGAGTKEQILIRIPVEKGGKKKSSGTSLDNLFGQ